MGFTSFDKFKIYSCAHLKVTQTDTLMREYVVVFHYKFISNTSLFLVQRKLKHHKFILFLQATIIRKNVSNPYGFYMFSKDKNIFIYIATKQKGVKEYELDFSVCYNSGKTDNPYGFYKF